MGIRGGRDAINFRDKTVLRGRLRPLRCGAARPTLRRERHAQSLGKTSESHARKRETRQARFTQRIIARLKARRDARRIVFQ